MGIEGEYACYNLTRHSYSPMLKGMLTITAKEMEEKYNNYKIMLEQIVQAMAGVLAYNLAENDEKIKFDYNFQNSHKGIEDELEL